LFPCFVPLFGFPVLPPCFVSPLFGFPVSPPCFVFPVRSFIHSFPFFLAALNAFVVLMEKSLSKTRAGYTQLRADVKTAVEEAEVTKAALETAIAAGTADAQSAKSDFNEHRLC
jgi:hypothetical protein